MILNTLGAGSCVAFILKFHVTRQIEIHDIFQRFLKL